MRCESKKLERAAQLLARGQLRIVDPDDDAPAPDDEIAEAFAAIGLKVEGELEIEETFELWPENVEAFGFWRGIQTQWLYAGNGVATGLAYEGVRACMEMRDIPREKRAELFGSVQVMESATLREWASQR